MHVNTNCRSEAIPFDLPERHWDTGHQSARGWKDLKSVSGAGTLPAPLIRRRNLPAAPARIKACSSNPPNSVPQSQQVQSTRLASCLPVSRFALQVSPPSGRGVIGGADDLNNVPGLTGSDRGSRLRMPDRLRTGRSVPHGLQRWWCAAPTSATDSRRFPPGRRTTANIEHVRAARVPALLHDANFRAHLQAANTERQTVI